MQTSLQPRIVYITGMSGTGKSSLIEYVVARGYAGIDTDYGDWKIYSAATEEWILDAAKLLPVLRHPNNAVLFIAGCCSNQKEFYQFFDCIILLSGSIETILDRVAKRKSNNYGKTEAERNEIIANFQNIEPLLRRHADYELDADTMSIQQMGDKIIAVIETI